MRFLIDAQLPQSLIRWFEKRGHAAEHVRDVLDGQAPDRAIAERARDLGLILVTKDDDFALRYPPTDYVPLWLRCGNMSNRALTLWLDEPWSAIEARLAEGERVIEVR